MSGNRLTKREREELLRRAREEDGPALGRLLESYRGTLSRAVRSQIGRRLRRKVDPADVVQEVFLKAHRDFPGFRGRTEEELTHWLRQVLATCLAMLVRRYFGTRRRDVRRECELPDEPGASAHALDQELVAPGDSPSE